MCVANSADLDLEVTLTMGSVPPSGPVSIRNGVMWKTPHEQVLIESFVVCMLRDGGSLLLGGN